MVALHVPGVVAWVELVADIVPMLMGGNISVKFLVSDHKDRDGLKIVGGYGSGNVHGFVA
jgi:hypothetical protein